MSANKHWTIRAVSNKGAVPAFERQGEALFVNGAQAAEISPVEYLLIATAGCLALSCRAVLGNGHGSDSSVEVTALGIKAAEPPSRLERIDLAVRLGSEIDAVEAASIVQKAKKLCTVTNTLLGSVAIEVHSSTGSRPEEGHEGQPAGQADQPAGQEDQLAAR
jgi:uncharacterized OsmC-like protein